MTLGQRLRELRINHDPYLRLRDVARSAGVDFTRWSRIENDREQPERELVVRLAPMLGADLGELLRLWEEWTEAPPPDLTNAFICRRQS